MTNKLCSVDTLVGEIYDAKTVCLMIDLISHGKYGYEPANINIFTLHKAHRIGRASIMLFFAIYAMTEAFEDNSLASNIFHHLVQLSL